MPFHFQRLAIPDVVLVEAQSFADDRGFFAETFKHSAFAGFGLSQTFVQDNMSHSCRGVLRGLHYQKNPAAQAKLVMVLRGRIFDVAADLRRSSPTYRQWVGVTLTAGDLHMLYVPEGFAHGFCVLSKEADVLYKVTHEYVPHLDRGILWNDPDLGVAWPIDEPILSPKDARLPLLRDSDNDF
jgi:dTDP-4-dehydrorhamnose 3,5-epimerase